MSLCFCSTSSMLVCLHRLILPHPLPNSHIRPPTCSYYFFFRRAKGSKISNVADATNPESAHAKYAESDVAPFGLPKTSSPPKLNVLNNSPIKPTPLYHFLFMKIARLMTKSKQKLKFLADLCNSTTLFLCFCETFLHDGIQDSEIQIPDFSIVRSDRYSRVGGGVCVYVRTTVNFKICLCFSNSVRELLILKLQNPSTIIIIIYRPSCLDCNFIDVISRTEQYILTISAPLPNIILLGDFNFPLIDWSNPNSQCPMSSPLFHLSDHLFLSQQVSKPTRNSNILDLIFSPNNLINSIDICDTFISDHRMLTVETNIPMSPPCFPQN